jgi:hypothetical protein
LEGAVLAVEEELIAHLPWAEAMEGEEETDGGEGGEGCCSCFFAAEELEEKLEKTVDCNGFVRVANDGSVLGKSSVAQANPRVDGVDGTHEQNPHHVPLKLRALIGSDVICNELQGEEYGSNDERTRNGPSEDVKSHPTKGEEC